MEKYLYEIKLFYLSFQVFSFDNIGDGLNCVLSREFIFFDVEKIIILVKMKLPNLWKTTSNHFIRKFSLTKCFKLRLIFYHLYLVILTELEHVIVGTSREHDFTSCKLKIVIIIFRNFEYFPFKFLAISDSKTVRGPSLGHQRSIEFNSGQIDPN